MPTRVTQLANEVQALRRQFLPGTFDPLGNYAHRRKVQAHTRAFLVLSHAAVESYLEEWAKEIARSAETLWKKSGRVSVPLTFLLNSLGERSTTPNMLSVHGAKDSHQRLSASITALFLEYYKRIKDNHGIKEKNVVSLFDPLGVPTSAFGSTLLPNLDALGSLRGKHAHYSAKAVAAVASILDPELEHRRVTDLIADLAQFEAWLIQYKRRIR